MSFTHKPLLYFRTIWWEQWCCGNAYNVHVFNSDKCMSVPEITVRFLQRTRTKQGSSKVGYFSADEAIHKQGKKREKEQSKRRQPREQHERARSAALRDLLPTTMIITNTGPRGLRAVLSTVRVVEYDIADDTRKMEIERAQPTSEISQLWARHATGGWRAKRFRHLRPTTAWDGEDVTVVSIFCFSTTLTFTRELHLIEINGIGGRVGRMDSRTMVLGLETTT